MSIEKNLFYYASTELTQDALLAYLFMNYESNKILVNKMVSSFVGKETIGKIVEIRVIKQYNRIDLLLEVYLTDEKILIIIEDKVQSNIHNNQLQRYYNFITKDKKYLEFTKKFIFYKLDFKNLGDTSEIERLKTNNNIEWNGYYIEDIISLFDDVGEVDPIIEEYSKYLKYIECEIKLSSNKPLSKWSDLYFKAYTHAIVSEFTTQRFEIEISNFRGKKGRMKVDSELLEYYLEFSFENERNRIELISKNGALVTIPGQLFNSLSKRTRKFPKDKKRVYLRRINLDDSIDIKKLVVELLKEYDTACINK